jgi:hypothetical protein
MLSALQTCSITHACSPTLIYTLRNHHTPHHRHSFRSKPHAVSLSTHHIAAGCKLQPAAWKLPLAAPMCLWCLKAFQRLGQHTGCTACVFTHTQLIRATDMGTRGAAAVCVWVCRHGQHLIDPANNRNQQAACAAQKSMQANQNYPAQLAQCAHTCLGTG